MEQKYTYKNGTIYITGLTEKSIENIKYKTEHFLKQVIKEQTNGYINKTGSIREK